ncbi:hypothetical protein [Comamonas fluminis]|uniref:hypothetical protein n=1 Tax=Comamonas fluminis TaxID=2796366 RepID=UPI001C453A6B|nr:hypothetical protein [Comamonas fluminis]
MSITSHTPLISPLPGQEDQSARLAASAEVGQVEGTIYWYRNEYKTSTGIWLVSGFCKMPRCFPASGFDAIEWRSVPCIGFDMGRGQSAMSSTLTLEQFQRWLETCAHEAFHAIENPPECSATDLALHREGCEIVIGQCAIATRALMSFKLERGA